jgi:hypothetical protein
MYTVKTPGLDLADERRGGKTGFGRGKKVVEEEGFCKMHVYKRSLTPVAEQLSKGLPGLTPYSMNMPEFPMVKEIKDLYKQ